MDYFDAPIWTPEQIIAYEIGIRDGYHAMMNAPESSEQRSNLLKLLQSFNFEMPNYGWLGMLKVIEEWFAYDDEDLTQPVDPNDPIYWNDDQPGDLGEIEAREPVDWAENSERSMSAMRSDY